MTGFNVDEQQVITVPSGWGWNDKTGSRWRAGDFESPPPKSKLLAKDPNWIDITPWLSDDDERDAMDNEKPPAMDVWWWKSALLTDDALAARRALVGSTLARAWVMDPAAGKRTRLDGSES